MDVPEEMQLRQGPVIYRERRSCPIASFSENETGQGKSVTDGPA